MGLKNRPVDMEILINHFHFLPSSFVLMYMTLVFTSSSFGFPVGFGID